MSKLKKTDSKFFLSNTSISELLKISLSKKIPFRFRVKGFSMYPFIKNNDILTVFPLDSFLINIGDIAAFLKPETNQLIVHRAVAVKEKYYLMKGDAVFKTDGLIPIENILGVVKKIERKRKSIVVNSGFKRFIIAFLSKKNISPLVFSIRIKTIRFSKRFL